ncbi:MAG: helix-turn-helix domain-containing protein [Waterburya sp.]
MKSQNESIDMIVKKLKKLRLGLGLSQYDFAKALNVDDRTYQRWEYGERTPKLTFPQTERLIILLEQNGFDFKEFLTTNDLSPKPEREKIPT